MVLGCCVNGSTAAVTLEMRVEVHKFESHLKHFFFI